MAEGLKRAVDVFGSVFGIIVLSPMCACIAVAVRVWGGPGPILYPWKVVGRNGRYFTGYKFRTMVRDADQLKAELLVANEMKGPVFKLTCDPRVTPVGRLLRRWSLDELPQLWSVLRGDMSLVGPRPPLQTEWIQFTDYQRRKLSVTPGMSCLWQIGGRNKVADLDEWVRLDLEYIENWSLWLDFKILMKTVGAIVGRTGK
jgi:lipopolysaccharide/colanic/teichoic acid biosynthesis glycosyltransferase